MNGGGSPFFKENGNYQATHVINTALKKLLNLSTPSEPYEAATKEYVDQRQHIIAVHTHYRGNLIKDKYQFTFGRNVSSELDIGFLVPQSGRIKKIQTKTTYEGKDFYGDIFEIGSIFTIIAIRDTGEVSNLLTYECYIIGGDPTTTHYVRRNYRFDRNPENIPISEGDVINIGTEKDYRDVDIDRGMDRPISYLFIFLLELDP